MVVFGPRPYSSWIWISRQNNLKGLGSVRGSGVSYLGVEFRYLGLGLRGYLLTGGSRLTSTAGSLHRRHVVRVCVFVIPLHMGTLNGIVGVHL